MTIHDTIANSVYVAAAMLIFQRLIDCQRNICIGRWCEIGTSSSSGQAAELATAHPGRLHYMPNGWPEALLPLLHSQSKSYATQHHSDTVTQSRSDAASQNGRMEIPIMCSRIPFW